MFELSTSVPMHVSVRNGESLASLIAHTNTNAGRGSCGKRHIPPSGEKQPTSVSFPCPYTQKNFIEGAFGSLLSNGFVHFVWSWSFASNFFSSFSIPYEKFVASIFCWKSGSRFELLAQTHWESQPGKYSVYAPGSTSLRYPPSCSSPSHRLTWLGTR